MIKVIVTGAAGRMGARLVALTKESAALTLAGAVERKGHTSIGEDAGEVAGCGHAGVRIAEDLSAVLEQGEVVIDFSAPEAGLEHLPVGCPTSPCDGLGDYRLLASDPPNCGRWLAISRVCFPPI